MLYSKLEYTQLLTEEEVYIGSIVRSTDSILDMDTCEELLEAQDTAFTLIQRILVNFNKLPKARKTAVAVRTRIESLKAHWDTCQQQHVRLCALVDEATRQQSEYFVKDKFLLISDTVEQIMDTLSEGLERLQPSTVQANLDMSNSSHESRITPVHLPRIDIPKFSGELTKWENFRDVFESLVANRSDLSNVQKLHYLKANLTGVASRVLNNTQITDANYATAWELLKRRYNNPRAVVNTHLQTFVELPSVSAHSPDDLITFRDKSNDIHTALMNLKRPIKHREQNSVKSFPSLSSNTPNNLSCNPSILNSEASDRVMGASIASNTFSHTSIKATLLPTAMVMLRSSKGHSACVRALLDQGSQATFVSESIAQLIKAEREIASITVSGVRGTQTGTVKTVAKFSVKPCSRKGPIIKMKALVMNKLTAYVPLPIPIDTKSELLENLILADPEPSGRKKVDLLIGADYLGSVLLDGLVRGASGGPTAQRTIFGWIIYGPVTSIPQKSANYQINVNHVSALDPLYDSIRKF